MAFPIGTIANFRTQKKHYTGRIVKKIGQSRVLDQSRGPNGPATISSASRSRVVSTHGFQGSKNFTAEGENELNRTSGINFRVRRPSRSLAQGVNEFESE